MWFDSWSDVLRVVYVGTAAYLTVIVVLRVAGKRSLAKLNAFDLVVTVALGSILATIVLNSQVSWSEGAAALALLAILQFVVTWTSAHTRSGRKVVTAEPTLVLRDGKPMPEAMRAQRLSLDEVRQAVRSTGAGDLSDIAAVVLETDGTLSVIAATTLGNGSALEEVRRGEERR